MAKKPPQPALHKALIALQDGKTAEVKGAVFTLLYGPERKPMTVIIHPCGPFEVLTHYRTGYRIAHMNYTLGYRLRGDPPSMSQAASDTLGALIDRIGLKRFEKRVAKLPTLNPGSKS